MIPFESLVINGPGSRHEFLARLLPKEAGLALEPCDFISAENGDSA